ncbi:MAG: hypothetical protein C0467_20000 [Planctomycetaceae bacterium]|nr:hypothetical protein [Planctomycetaceae bacterium]
MRSSAWIVGGDTKIPFSALLGIQRIEKIESGQSTAESPSYKPSRSQKAPRPAIVDVEPEPSPERDAYAGGRNNLKRYLSVKQVVQRLNNAVSIKLIYKLIATGKLRANKVTGKVLIDEESLVELIEGASHSSQVKEQTQPLKRPKGRPRTKANRSGKMRIELW